MTARFQYYLRRATNEDAPLGYRVRGLTGMVESYSFLTKLGYATTWRLLGEALDLREQTHYLSGAIVTSGNRWLTGEEINAIAHLLQQQRERFLREMQEFQSMRRAEKAAGKRQPSRRQRAELYSRTWVPPRTT